MVSMDEGMQIDSSDEQLENTDSPRRETRLPLSNVILRRLAHEQKHEREMVSMDEGKQIDASAEQS
jgi:hypothetical protein